MNSAINGRALSGLTGLSLAHANTLVVNLALAVRTADVPVALFLDLRHRRIYSVTSLARCWSSAGTSKPSAFAVLRLMVSTKLTGA